MARVFRLNYQPKALLLFGAFVPQFVDSSGNVFFQSVVYGAVFMFVAGVLDSIYALLAGRAGSIFSKNASYLPNVVVVL